MSSPWVVECKGCRCFITCFAVDPQAEHMKQADAPPAQSALVTCSCCWKTYRYAGEQIGRGNPKQNPGCACKWPSGKPDGALLVAASIVAAIRLRGQEITPSPKLNAVVYDSILLARMIAVQLQRS